MRKEVIVAIVSGLIISLVVGGFIWWRDRSENNLSSSAENTPSGEEATTISITATDQKESSLSVPLAIDSPVEGEIATEEEIEISGQTLSQAVVVIIYPEGETIVSADNEGNFSGTATLTGGANEIQITAYDDQGNSAEETLTIVYSTATL